MPRPNPSSSGDELGNADEIVSNEVEHEVGANGSKAAMLGLAHGAVQFPQPKMHSTMARQDWEMR